MPTESRPKLLLIDGHSIAYRAFFALPVENFSTVTGQHTNGVFGFTSMLINVLRDEAPTHLGVAFDVSRKTFRAEIYPEYKANRSSTPDEFRGQLDLVKEVLKALNIAYVEKEGFEADDVIGTLATQAEAQGFEVLICTGDRDAFQLVSDNVTVLYPRKGVSDLGRMTPKAVEERYFATPARYPDLAALVGESSDNLPGVPGVGPKTAAKWLEMYDGLENLAAHAGELKGKAARGVPGAGRATCCAIARSTRWCSTWTCRSARRTCCASRGTGRRPISCSTGWSSGCSATGCWRRLPNEAEIVPEGGFDLSTATLEPGELGGWLDEHAIGERTGVDVIGHWGSGTGDVTALSLAAADGAAAYVDVTELVPADENALAAWLADPEPAQGHARRQGSAAGDLGPRLGPGRADLGHPGGGVPGPAGPAHLRPGRPDHPLSEARAEGRGRAGDHRLRPAVPGLRRRRLRGQGGRRGVDGPGPGGDRPGRRAGHRDRAAQRDQPALRGRAAAAAHPGPDGADRGRRRRRPPGGARVGVRGQGQPGGQRRVRGARQADQPRFAEAAAGGAVRRAGHAEDPAHPDRLHHRRRRTAVAVRQDRAPVPGPPAGAPRRHPAQADGRGAAQVGGRRRPDPHHVRADHRGDRPAVQHRPQPAEHPDPHRGGPADPAGVRRRARLRRADVGRLLPDRDADHGPRQRGRRPDRGVQVRDGLPHGDRVPGVRGGADGGHARPSGRRSRR